MGASDRTLAPRELPSAAASTRSAAAGRMVLWRAVQWRADGIVSLPSGEHQCGEAALGLHIEVDAMLFEQQIHQLVLPGLDCLRAHNLHSALLMIKTLAVGSMAAAAAARR